MTSQLPLLVLNDFILLNFHNNKRWKRFCRSWNIWRSGPTWVSSWPPPGFLLFKGTLSHGAANGVGWNQRFKPRLQFFSFFFCLTSCLYFKHLRQNCILPQATVREILIDPEEQTELGSSVFSQINQFKETRPRLDSFTIAALFRRSTLIIRSLSVLFSK